MPAGSSSSIRYVRRSRVFRVFTVHIVHTAERFRLELTGVPYKRKKKEGERPGCKPSTLGAVDRRINPLDHDAPQLF